MVGCLVKGFSKAAETLMNGISTTSGTENAVSHKCAVLLAECHKVIILTLHCFVQLASIVNAKKTGIQF